MYFFVSVPDRPAHRLQCTLEELPLRLATDMQTTVSTKPSTTTKTSVILQIPDDRVVDHCLRMIRILGFDVSPISP